MDGLLRTHLLDACDSGKLLHEQSAFYVWLRLFRLPGWTGRGAGLVGSQKQRGPQGSRRPPALAQVFVRIHFSTLSDVDTLSEAGSGFFRGSRRGCWCEPLCRQ